MTEYPPGGTGGTGDEQGNPPPQPPYGQPQQPPPYGAPPYGQPPQPPQYGAPPYGAPPGAVPMTQSDARMWALLAHVGGILLSFIAPLVVFLMYKDRDEFVRDQSVEALNFQITVVIAVVISSLLMIVLIGFLLLAAVGIAALVLPIMGGIAANRGERYRYPVALRLIK